MPLPAYCSRESLVRVLALLSLIVLVVVTGCGTDDRGETGGDAAAADGFTDHGIAVPIAGSRGVVATEDGDGTPRILVWPRDYMGVGSVLAINATNGRTVQVATPDGKHESSPFAFVLSSENTFYSQFNSSFYAFDADSLQFTYSADVASRFAMSLTEAPDGTIWSAGYPDSRLYAFNPESRQLTRYGSVNEETWRQYPRSVAVDSAGWVYLGIGITDAQILAFNPATNERRSVLDDDERPHGTADVFRGTNGRVYGNVPESAEWYELFEGTSTRVDEPPVPAVDIKKGTQSGIYREFPDGRYLESIDLPAKTAEIRVADGDTLEHITYDYGTQGALIQSLIAGPDQRVYGSTALPLRLFALDPQSGAYDYHALPGGQVNTFDRRNDTLFLAVYPGGILYRYEPSKAWNPGESESSNPGKLLESSPTIHRPHAVLASSTGRHVIFGGTPDYGLTGGGMVIYDPSTNDTTLLTDDDLLPDHSIRSLESLENGHVLVGTTISPGTGGETRAEEAHLYIFDPVSRDIVFDTVPAAGAPQIRGLERASNGLVFGFAAPSTLFVFDPDVREIVHSEQLGDYGSVAGHQGSRVLTTGANGTIYALFRDAVVQIDPDTYEHAAAARPPVEIDTGLGVLNGRLYFSHGSSVWSRSLERP